MEGFDPSVSGGVASHHIAARTLGRMGNIETVLSSSIATIFFAAFLVVRTMWYGSATTPIELLVLLIINAIKDTSSKKYIEGLVLDGDKIVRVDVPFRREKSKYSVKQVGVTIEFYGGELNGVSYSDPTTVKKYARLAQLGEIF
ncbi:hypothetical protein Goshw_010432 [Gossypium schwendimanii]|uniref:Uncharacterized protein n=2 Tax=Gossypium schwendimanii TaxID=34291 RepID=A0A7J9NCY5_GOSSC|nr:hypothetical protein [Gossypium schwendimanii]